MPEAQKLIHNHMKKDLIHNHNRGEPCEPCSVAMGMYECYWCKKWSYKAAWGPGWIRCPLCKKIAPTAEEWKRLEQERIYRTFWRYKWRWLNCLWSYQLGIWFEPPCDDVCCPQSIGEWPYAERCGHKLLALPEWDGLVGYRTGDDGHWFAPFPKDT